MMDDRTDPSSRPTHSTRREIGASGAIVPLAMARASGASAPPRTTTATVSVSLTVNGVRHALTLDPRTTLLDVPA